MVVSIFPGPQSQLGCFKKDLLSPVLPSPRHRPWGCITIFFQMADLAQLVSQMISLLTTCKTSMSKAKYGQGLEFKKDLLFTKAYKNHLLLEPNDGNMPFFF